MDFTLLIEWLHQKKSITPLEKDILDTWNELQKSPFDCCSAQRQIMQNNAKHQEIFLQSRRLSQKRGGRPIANCLRVIADICLCQPEGIQNYFLRLCNCMVQSIYSVQMADHHDLLQLFQSCRDGHVIRSLEHCWIVYRSRCYISDC